MDNKQKHYIMKKILFLIAITLITFSCKNSEEKTDVKTQDAVSTESNNATMDVLYQGDFIYLADAAVLKGNNFIYGVAINDLATELAKQVKPIQETEFDMVEVIVKGTITSKPEEQEGWEEIITITEIVQVSQTPSKIDIKLEDKK